MLHQQFSQALVENHEDEDEVPDPPEPPVSQGGRVKRKAKVLNSASQDSPEACGSTPASSQGRRRASQGRHRL
jgi:hypothetical protein